VSSFRADAQNEDCATKGVKGRIEAVGLRALCNDAEVIFHGEDFGGSCSVDGLIVSERISLFIFRFLKDGASPGQPRGLVSTSALNVGATR